MMKSALSKWSYITLGFISSLSGRKGRTAIGSILGDIMRLIGSKRRNITFDNLKKAFPALDDSEILNILKKAYRNLGIVFFEASGFSRLSDKKLKELISYENPELINELHSRGKGLILLSGHFGNWELLAYSASLYSGLPITIVVKPQRNEEVDKLINSFRTRRLNKVVSMYTAAKTIVSSLKSGNTIALLVDQSANEDKDVFVDFFGRPADTFEAPAALSLRFGAPIIMGFAVRQEDGRYKVKLREIKSDDLSSGAEGVKALTERHVKELENEIRLRPELWAWQHRRWKHSPKGEHEENAAK